MIKYYKIPEWHDLYGKYENYLRNREKSKKIILQFMRKYNLMSSLIKIGETEKKAIIKGEQELNIEPYFMFKDENPKIIEHDLAMLKKGFPRVQVSWKEPNKEGFYELRKNSPYLKEWKKILEKNDNFKILDVPDIKDYIISKKGVYTKWFQKDKEDLYLRIESKKDFVVSNDLIEIKEKQAKRIFNELT